MVRTAVLFLAAALVLGCSGSPSTKTVDDAAKKAKEVEEAAAKKRNEFIKDYQKQLDDADSKLKDWKEKADKATGDAKVKLQKSYDDAKGRRDELAKQMTEFGKASVEGWDKLKDGFDKAGRELNDAVKKAADEFK
jgi:Flp pilus assembly protein TadB